MSNLFGKRKKRRPECLHAHHYLRRIERDLSPLRGPWHQPWLDEWLDDLETELGNLRVALDWVLACHHDELALRLAGGLLPFWHALGYVAEGQTWLEHALATSTESRTAARARALYAAGVLAAHRDDLELATTRAAESVALYRTLDNDRSLAESLNLYGSIMLSAGEPHQAKLLCEESLDRSTRLDDRISVAFSILHLGRIAAARGDLELAHLRRIARGSPGKATHPMAPLWRNCFSAESFTNAGIGTGYRDPPGSALYVLE